MNVQIHTFNVMELMLKKY